jgi:ribonuclease P protein component
VDRNRLRRRLRSIADESCDVLPAGAYLVHAGPDAVRLSFGELRTVMVRALEIAIGQPVVGSADREGGN